MPAPSASHHIFDRKLLRLRRERAACKMKSHDFLLQETARNLEDRLNVIKRDFQAVLDLGGQNGISGAVVSDLSFAAAKQRQGCVIVADEEYLPFQKESFDAVISNLTLQWVNDLPGALLQIRQVLKPDGLFLAALAGGESLKELRQSLMEAEMNIAGGVSPRVSPFVDVRDMGMLLQRAGFALPVVDLDTVEVEYQNMFQLMKDLRGMGATNALLQRLKKPTRRSVMLEAARIYQEKFGNSAGGIRATFQVLYVIGWMPHDSQQKPLTPGSAKNRLADALKAEEKVIS